MRIDKGLVCTLVLCRPLLYFLWITSQNHLNSKTKHCVIVVERNWIEYNAVGYFVLAIKATYFINTKVHTNPNKAKQPTYILIQSLFLALALNFFSVIHWFLFNLISFFRWFINHLLYFYIDVFLIIICKVKKRAAL